MIYLSIYLSCNLLKRTSFNVGRTTQKIGRRVLKNLWHYFKRERTVGNPPAGVITRPTVNASKCNMKTETNGAVRACRLDMKPEHPVSVFRLFAFFLFFFVGGVIFSVWFPIYSPDFSLSFAFPLNGGNGLMVR